MKQATGSMPTITHISLFDMQVCVPNDWNDNQVEVFAEKHHPCGTTKGWTIRRAGSQERVQCEKHKASIHIMLDA